MPGVDCAQAHGGIRDDREDRDDGGANDQRALGVLDKNDDERRDRDDRRHLEDDRVGKKAALDDRALHEQESDQSADGDRQRKRDQCYPQRHP